MARFDVSAALARRGLITAYMLVAWSTFASGAPVVERDVNLIPVVEGKEVKLARAWGKATPDNDINCHVLDHGTPYGRRIDSAFEPTDDPDAPILFHKLDTFYLAAGNPASDTLVAFMHTTAEMSGVASFYNTLYGWNPPFYAVALSMPGTCGTPSVLCEEATVDCKPRPEIPSAPIRRSNSRP